MRIPLTPDEQERLLKRQAKQGAFSAVLDFIRRRRARLEHPVSPESDVPPTVPRMPCGACNKSA